MTQLSVVIPVYNNWWMTARALRALDRLRPACSIAFETIVVDNASSDETQTAIAAFPWVRYARMERNTNFAGACNAGARMASAPLVLFLNNDAYPLGDALTPLVRAFDREEIAIASGALLFEDGVTQGAGFVVLPNAHWHSFCRSLPSELDDVTHSRDAPGVSGAAMAVRTPWFLEAGGFDESYINGFEDVDLCMRARDAGRAIRYVADARFAHYEGASAGRFDREAQNERRFYDRWAGGMARIPRTARGSVGAIALHAPPEIGALASAGLEDLESALRAFGHPVVRGALPVWSRLDARFRGSAGLAWFTAPAEGAGISIERKPGERATIRTHGAVDISVPWLPCADVARAATLPIRQTGDPACATVAVAGFEAAPPDRRRDLIAAFDALAASAPPFALVVLSGQSDAAPLLSRYGERARAVSLPTAAGPAVDVACVVQAGLTDDAACGNVLLAQAGIASVAIAGEELLALFAPDVALIAHAGAQAPLAQLIGEPAERARYAALASADATRRFSPRRSAIRTIDLLCAARFGLERPAKARTNSPT